VPSSGTCSKPCFGQLAKPGDAQQQQSDGHSLSRRVVKRNSSCPLTGKRAKRHCHLSDRACLTPGGTDGSRAVRR
jgi:hypothetical protein